MLKFVLFDQHIKTSLKDKTREASKMSRDANDLSPAVDFNDFKSTLGNIQVNKVNQSKCCHLLEMFLWR